MALALKSYNIDVPGLLSLRVSDPPSLRCTHAVSTTGWSSSHRERSTRVAGIRTRGAASCAAADSSRTMGQELSGGPAAAEGDASDLPLREIPGGYGIPYLSQLVNRWRFLRMDSETKFWEDRMKQFNSTVIRTNMMPGWPWTDSRCVMLLDQKSYLAVLDSDKVDKHKAFAGTFMPSTSYTGGLEMCAYLDVSDKKHEQLKNYCFALLKQGASKWAPEFHASVTSAFLDWESKLSENKPAVVSAPLPEFLFRFLVNAVTSADITDARILDSDRPVIGDLRKWTVFQLMPVLNTRALPFFLEELLHVAPIPASLTQGAYDKLVAFLETYAQESLALGLDFGLTKEETVHNLVFFLILNGHGGFCTFFPVILREVGKLPELQAELRAEVRAATKGHGNKVTMGAVMNDMPLVKATVFEALRIDPPVRYQYARARKDFELSSHDARFQIKKGEFLGGVNWAVSRDPKVFKSDPAKFQPRRFMGPEGEKLLNHLVWSNGPQTGQSSVSNKQCAGKDLVPLTGSLLLAELFMRYDSFETDVVDKAIVFKSLQRRVDLDS